MFTNQLLNSLRRQLASRTAYKQAPRRERSSARLNRLAVEMQLESRAMLTPVTHFHADFSDAGGAPSLDEFTIENSIGAPVDGLWHLSTGRGNDPGHSSDDSLYYGTGETSTGGGNYDVGQTAGRITSPAINNIPAGAVLSFNYFLQTENASGFDELSVLISANSGPFTSQSINLSPDSQGFLIASLDLGAFSGMNIQVRFEFDTIDGEANNFEGWYIDDVIVTTGTRNIQGTVFNDLNDNDILDGDPGFPDTRVFIDDDNDGVYDTDYFVRNPSNATPVSIQDVSTVTSTITIGGSALEMVRDVNVTLDITHTYDADLDVFLIAPNGTRIELFTDVGDGVADFTSTTLDDDAATSITAGTFPFTGTFRPEGSLAVLNGINPAGTWTLEITDDVFFDTGTLNSWSLQLGVTREFQTTTTNLPIPDAGTFTSPINVSGTTGYIQDIDVQLDISHVAVRDLDIFLIAPNGVRVELVTDAGNNGIGSNFSQTIFDDEATTAIVASSPPFTGRFRPEGFLSAFDGYTANGTWQLEVTDDQIGFSGTLNSWSLSLTIGERTDFTDAIGNYDIPVTEVGNSFRVRAATPTGFFPTAPSTGEQLVTVAPEASTVTGVSFGSQRPDFRMISATGDGGTGISITYEITNGDIAPVNIEIFQSSDALLDVGDTLISTLFPGPADLTVGIHTVNLVLGVDIVLPGAGIADLNTDYRLLFSADSSNSVDEPDLDPSNEDNTVAFAGVYHEPGGPVMAFGLNTADTVTVTPNGLNVDVNFNNLVLASYPIADVPQFRLRGAGGDDNFTSGANNATMSIPLAIWGGAGLDTIQGGDGNDTLSGGADNDLYVFFPSENVESDTVEEFNIEGRDTLDFSQLSTAVTLNLGSTSPQGVNTNRTLTLTSSAAFEDATGGSAADSLTGNATGNQLFGFGGSDTLDGAGGGDTLVGGANDDVYNFGSASESEADSVIELPNEGNDTLNFAALTVGVTLNINNNAIQNVHTNRTLKLNSFSTFENVIGGSGSDVLTGNSLANTLSGNGGADTLNGFTGNDTLIGGLGDDTYTFSAATAGLEADVVTELADQGTDTLNFAAQTVGVTLNINNNAIQNVHTNRTLKLNSFSTFENVIGGSGSDVLTGNALANTLTGNGGADTFNGFTGNDTLIGGLGDDTYTFSVPTAGLEADVVTELTGQGTDTLNFAALTVGVTLNINNNAVQNVHTNRTLKLNSFSTFENVVGGSGSDVLTGNALANTLTGNGGSDTLNGFTGNDTLIGGLGDDTYTFSAATAGLEADVVTELADQGTDTLNFAAQTVGVTLNINNNAIQNVHTNRTLKLNSFSTFENVIGGSGSDVLTGNALANTLTGNGGADTFNGFTGNDTLIGGLGDDTYTFSVPTAGLEADVVTELTGQGTDTLNFAALTVGVTLNINNNAVQNVHTNRTLKLNSFSTFENVVGGSGSDVLTGNSLANTLTGNGGSDTLNGFTGNDTLIGGLGDDTYTFSVPTAGAEADVVTELANQGTDTLNFSTLTTAVTLNLELTGAQEVHLNRTLALNLVNSFENAIGGSGADVLRGNALANSLSGGNGNDILVGLDGIDVLTGGVGNDILVGGRGADNLNGNQGEDLLIAGFTLSAGVEDSGTFLTTVSTTWFEAGTFATRRTALIPVLVPASTVINDAEADTLTSSLDLSLDWLFAAVADSVTRDAGDILTLL
jgi:Ca2+-binding RTX toxin-like protein/subtilisin-like proprotein convertase family protein